MSSARNKKLTRNVSADYESDDSSASDDEGNFMGWDHSKREKRRLESLKERRRNGNRTSPSSNLPNRSNQLKKQESAIEEADDEAETFYNGSSDDDSEEDDEEDENGSSYYTTDSDSDEDSENSNDEHDNDGKSGWSLRVRLLEVENLPTQLAPSTPFCPIIKFGLLSTTKHIFNMQDDENRMDHKSKNETIKKNSEKFRLAKIKNSRGRCTTSPFISVKHENRVQWYEEFRWDSVTSPLQTVLAIELCGKSLFKNNVIPKKKILPIVGNEEVPVDIQSPDSSSLPKPSQIERGLSLASFFRISRRPRFQRNVSAPSTSAIVSSYEMETANASAKVAQMLVEQIEEKNDQNQNSKQTEGKQPDICTEQNDQTAVELVQSSTAAHMPEEGSFEEDFQLGSFLIPLSQLPLEDATRIGAEKRQYAITDQWYPVDLSAGPALKASHKPESKNIPSVSPKTKAKKRSKQIAKLPRIRLEISFAATTCLDESEDDFTEDEEDDEGDASTVVGRDNDMMSVSMCSTVSRRSFMKEKVRKMSSRSKKSGMMAPSSKEPVIEPGIVDFISVVGAKDIGMLKDDDGIFGWVKSSPECCILEQFPENDDFHIKNGREAALPNKVEWFCFPEGCKLWRGVDPPTLKDLQQLNSSTSHSSLSTLQQASPNIRHHISSSNPAFDKCLNCATSFGWFVISSTSENYGSENLKTFGAVIRFYVPAPCGIDPTQDDFAQTSGSSVYQNENTSIISSLDSKSSTSQRRRSSLLKRVRFWVPMGICITSSYPIVGVLESILLRICQSIGSREINENLLHEDIANLIVNFQAPIPGVLHCSIPFLQYQRFHVTLAPPTGLPSLPHGGCITAVCKLIGATGLVKLLSALLTECKVLLHSNDVSNLPMVGEVITALMFPFIWELPYIPVLPDAMLEFVEAPMSYLVGVPSCALRWIDPEVLSDVVVVNLNSVASENGNNQTYKNPCLLPTHISSGISNEVLKLLKEAEEVEMQRGDHAHAFADEGIHLPRLEPEDLAEREFRVSITLHISSLLRGYHDCLFFVSSSQPVFNRERFLRTADALFEEKIDPSGIVHRIISPRSKRFLLSLVNTQSFHLLLERMYSEDHSFFPFFHDIMDALELNNENREDLSAMQKFTRATINQISTALQKVEDAVPTYRVQRRGLADNHFHSSFEDKEFGGEDTPMFMFTSQMLKPIVTIPQATMVRGSTSDRGTKSLSLQYLVEIEKNPWEYNRLFNISSDNPASQLQPKVTIRNAIGEGRYRLYIASKKNLPSVGNSDEKANLNNLLINNLLSSAKDEIEKMDTPTSASEASLAKDAEDREILRKCLERAIGASSRNSLSDKGENNFPTISFVENGRDLIQDAEIALQNPSAQMFLLALLSQRARLEKQRQLRQNAGIRRSQIQNGTSRILPKAFDCLVRLCNAMLRATMAEQDYESAYRLLTHTYGFCTVIYDPGAREGKKLVFMTAKIGMHPVFTDLSLWEKVIEIHVMESNSTNVRSDSNKGMAEYDATVTTIYEMIGYGVPTEELVRFVTRVSNAKGFFLNEKAQSLLSLVRKLSMKRDNEVSDNSSLPSYSMQTNGVDIESVMGPSNLSEESTILSDAREWNNSKGKGQREIEENGIAWYHPIATEFEVTHASSLSRVDSNSEIKSLGSSMRSKISQTVGKIELRSSKPQYTGQDNILNPTGFCGRNSITSVTCFGATAVVTGSLDGSVFLTHAISRKEVRGVRLEWGNNAKGVCPVTCLASVRAAQQPELESSSLGSEDAFLSATDGCRVVAGSAGGELNVWSLKDVCRKIIENEDHENYIPLNELCLYNGPSGEGPSKIELALSGHSLSGHEGGVSCLDVPSTVYRPDSLVSGGEDGLIKLWSLRNIVTAEGETKLPQRDFRASRFFGVKPFLQPEVIAGEQKSNGDAEAILSGHEGKVLCVKTAWHGDRVLSGGVDGKVMLWDLAGGDGKCLQEMIGHTLWVTHAQYWGPHTIVSASTDRSVALWDARVANDPLFILRHHNSHVSDIMVGARADPLMVTAGGDGTLATWDLRIMTSSKENLKSGKTVNTKTNRQPVAIMNHCDGSNCAGPLRLARGASSQDKSVLSAGTDGVIKEWDVATGRYLGKEFGGHSNGITCLTSFSENEGLQVNQREHERDSSRVCGIISCSWDGVVRLRRVLTKYDYHI